MPLPVLPTLLLKALYGVPGGQMQSISLGRDQILMI